MAFLHIDTTVLHNKVKILHIYQALPIYRQETQKLIAFLFLRKPLFTQTAMIVRIGY